MSFLSSTLYEERNDMGGLSPGVTLSPGPTLALTLNSPVPVGIVLCLLKLRFLPYKIGLTPPLDYVRKVHPKAFKGTRCPQLLGPLLHFGLRLHVLSIHTCSWTCFLSDFQKGFVLGEGRDSLY